MDHEMDNIQEPEKVEETVEQAPKLEQVENRQDKLEQQMIEMNTHLKSIRDRLYQDEPPDASVNKIEDTSENVEKQVENKEPVKVVEEKPNDKEVELVIDKPADLAQKPKTIDNNKKKVRKGIRKR